MKKIKVGIILTLVIILITIGIKTVFAEESANTFEGFNVLGTIEIPKTRIKYPILEKVTKKALEVSVARLYGVGINEPGNVVIVGHNYRNGLFFSENDQLEEGDEIYITGNNNIKEKYIVYKKFETPPEDTSYYEIDTKGEKIITLSSNTGDTSQRLIIQAKSEGVTNWTNPNTNVIGPGSESNTSNNNNNSNNSATETNSSQETTKNTNLATNLNQNNNKTNNNVTNNNIPKAGKNNIILVISILIIGVCGTILYIKSKKIK